MTAMGLLTVLILIALRVLESVILLLNQGVILNETSVNGQGMDVHLVIFLMTGVVVQPRPSSSM
jgi:hypothetical protein